ncbi:MAG: hypothetical protein FWE69_03855 [Clostridiales bacterium]|nr:hypothetical protein [Clostridiales bacterium]
MTGSGESAPPSAYWPQELERQLCVTIPGYTLSAIDETDIETLFSYVAHLMDKQAQAYAGLQQINGKWYRKADSFKPQDTRKRGE